MLETSPSRRFVLACASALVLTACPSDDTSGAHDVSSTGAGDDRDDEEDPDPTSTSTVSGTTTNDTTHGTESTDDPTDWVETTDDPTDPSETTLDPSTSTDTGAEGASTDTGDAPRCGDGIIEGEEQCEGDDLAGEDCISWGLDGGSLACGADCRFDLSMCTGWNCDIEFFAAADGCDCGCGVLDPDCLADSIDACEYCDGAGSCGISGIPCPGIIDPDDITSCDALAYWTCEDDRYGDGSICNCGCGVPDVDCSSIGPDACDVCNDVGSCEPDGDCASIDATNNGECIPTQWTCDGEFYDDIFDECDCGCGVLDPDCADATVASCEYCNDFGSCNAALCPGTIDPVDNATCTP